MSVLVLTINWKQKTSLIINFWLLCAGNTCIRGDSINILVNASEIRKVYYKVQIL